MSKLAFLGGQPLYQNQLDLANCWPPVNEPTGDNLRKLYLSRNWRDENLSAFGPEFAESHGAKYGLPMANGTVTLQCALGALGIGVGDEVLVPALTWMATAMAVHYVGATPVFVDIDKDTLCMDMEKVSQAITEKTKAIIPVHVYGSMVDIDKLLEITKKHNLKIVEDCAHMHGAKWDGKPIGSFGDVGSFSFEFSKTMSSGEGGICITNDSDLAERIHRMAYIGYGFNELKGQAQKKPQADLTCHNFRLTSFQALILRDQLKGLDDLLSRYGSNADYLEERLSQSTRIRFQKRGRKATTQGYYSWALIFDDPAYADIPIDIIQKAFLAEGFPSNPHYALGPIWGPVYKHILYNRGEETYRIDQSSCPVTEYMTQRTLIIIHYVLGLERERIEKIADIIEKVMAHCEELRGSTNRN